MPAAVSAKSQQIGKENFAIRGLQFCGFLKRHSGPIEAQISTIKPPPHHAKVMKHQLERFPLVLEFLCSLDL